MPSTQHAANGRLDDIGRDISKKARRSLRQARRELDQLGGEIGELGARAKHAAHGALENGRETVRAHPGAAMGAAAAAGLIAGLLLTARRR